MESVDPEKEKIQIDVLEIAIAEQRRVSDWISTNYEQVRVKILTFLGGGLGALTFLYSNGDLFIPGQVYGKIFYFAGLGMVIASLTILITSLRPRRWEFTIEDKELLRIHKVESKLEYLKYVRDKYMECYTINISAYEYKQKLFNISLYPLIFGVIILVIIKLFNKG